MALEDFTGYSEVDPNSRISKTATRVTWASLDRNETAYTYKDKTTDYFDGDFTHLLTVNATACADGAIIAFWALTNDLNDLRTIDNANGSWLSITMFGTGGGVWITLDECDSGSVFEDSYVASKNTPYYLKVVRDESVGTYGTLYCYIYSDPARTTLVDTLTLTLHTSKKDFRYIHAVNTFNASTTPFLGSGYTENLNLFEAEAGYAATYPINELLRASGIRRTFWSGLGGQSVYQVELALGGMTTSYVSPIGSRDIPSAVTPSAVIDPLRAYINRPPPITETGLPGVTMPFTSTAPTAPQMAKYAGMGSVEYDKIIQQGKVTEALREFGPITGPADLERFRTQYPQLGI